MPPRDAQGVLNELYDRTNRALRVRNTLLFVRKTVDEGVNNSAALQNDNDLFLALAANATYILDFYLVYNSTTVADLNVAFTFPTGTTLAWTKTGLNLLSTVAAGNLGGADGVAGTGNVVHGGAGATNVASIGRGLVRVGATTGNLQLQWAQGAAEATETVVRSDSWMSLLQVT